MCNRLQFFTMQSGITYIDLFFSVRTWNDYYTYNKIMPLDITYISHLVPLPTGYCCRDIDL